MEGFEKFGTVPTWTQLSNWCEIVARYWQWEWKIAHLPRILAIPPETIDHRAVDSAILKLLAAPKRPPEITDIEKPWLLHRLIFGAFFCRIVAEHGEHPIGDVRELLAIILINNWKDRARWNPATMQNPDQKKPSS